MYYSLTFPSGTTDYYLHASHSQLLQLAPPSRTVIITDLNINKHYGHLFPNYRVLIIKAGERSKSWDTIDSLAARLVDFEVHKTSMLIGIGGGVITDITGFLASVYMRGISVGFIPTSLLAMVDAAIGGKNGINTGVHKNMLGAIRQPRFILFDSSFLPTLPEQEWSNGFAEVIKYGCIGDTGILDDLEQQDLLQLRQQPRQLNRIIASCIDQKNRIILEDEQETGLRKILNFGHTAGHAFEILYQLQHGQAVALGMIVALIASEKVLGLSTEIRLRLVLLLQRYGLPVRLAFDPDKVMQTLKLDKKRNNDGIDFILLEGLGQALIRKLPFDTIWEILHQFAYESKH